MPIHIQNIGIKILDNIQTKKQNKITITKKNEEKKKNVKIKTIIVGSVLCISVSKILNIR